MCMQPCTEYAFARQARCNFWTVVSRLRPMTATCVNHAVKRFFRSDAQVGTPALTGDIGQPWMTALALGHNDLGDVPIDARAELLKAATLRLPLWGRAHQEGEARKLGQASGTGDCARRCDAGP